MLECWQEGQKNDECKKEYVVMRNAVQALSNMSCIKKEEDAITINTGTLMLGVAANQFIKNKTEQVTR